MLDGDAPALVDDPAQYGFSYAESTVWGNMFDSTTKLNPRHAPQELGPGYGFQAHVCRNHVEAWSPDAKYRVWMKAAAASSTMAIVTPRPSTARATWLRRPDHCQSWQSRLEDFLQTGTPEWHGGTRSRAASSLPTPFTPKTVGE